MRRNRLRERLRAGRPSLGTHVHSAWPAVVELVGHTGLFDYVEFVGEYAPYDLFALENLARAVDTFDHMTAMFKVEQQPRTYLAVRAIGAGIQNLLFADPRTPEGVRECGGSVRAETPEAGGLHGVGMRRDVGYVVDVGSPAFVQALDDAVVAIMIEKASAVDNLEALLSVPGVGLVQFGPAGYSMSIGLGGGQPRGAAVGPGRGHGAVRARRLLDEHRPRRAVESSARRRGGASRDQDGPGHGHRPARGDRASERGEGLSRPRRPPLLHGLGREHPVRLAQERGPRPARSARRGLTRRATRP